jgi:hypothetical protein
MRPLRYTQSGKARSELKFIHIIVVPPLLTRFFCNPTCTQQDNEVALHTSLTP